MSIEKNGKKEEARKINMGKEENVKRKKEKMRMYRTKVKGWA